jgi:hypothetical protein
MKYVVVQLNLHPASGFAQPARMRRVGNWEVVDSPYAATAAAYYSQIHDVDLRHDLLLVLNDVDILDIVRSLMEHS